jgi:RND family efflux transporter MFP subunit
MDADERSVLKYQQLAREGKRASAREVRIPCFLQLANETGYPHEGEIDFVDNRMDPTTGTIRGRGIFPNPDGYLIPGLFARVRVPGSGRYQTLLVPDAALVTDQTQKLLLVVGPDNVVQPRPVKPGAIFGDLRSIESGISVTDRVVINGHMQARPGVKVQPHEAKFPIDSFQLTSPGSPTTQALPATPPRPESAP